MYNYFGLDRVYILSTKTDFSFHLILGEYQSLLLKDRRRLLLQLHYPLGQSDYTRGLYVLIGVYNLSKRDYLTSKVSGGIYS